MFKTILTALLAAGLVGSMGCRRASESVAEKLMAKAIEKNGGGKANVNLSKGKMTVKTDKGEMVVAAGSGAAIPADFPKDVFVVKGATIQMAASVPGGFSLAMQSKESAENLMEKYAAEMKAQGWKTEATVNMGESMMTSFSKDTRKTSVVVAKADKGSQISLQVSDEKKE